MKSRKYQVDILRWCKFNSIDVLIWEKGVEAVHGAAAHDLGILTTPQLHWMVRTINKGLPAGESDYFNVLSSAFRCFSLYFRIQGCLVHGSPASEIPGGYIKIFGLSQSSLFLVLVQHLQLLNNIYGSRLSV